MSAVYSQESNDKGVFNIDLPHLYMYTWENKANEGEDYDDRGVSGLTNHNQILTSWLKNEIIGGYRNIRTSTSTENELKVRNQKSMKKTNTPIKISQFVRECWNTLSISNSNISINIQMISLWLITILKSIFLLSNLKM